MFAEYTYVYHGTRIKSGIRKTRIFTNFLLLFELCVLRQVLLIFRSSLLAGKAAQYNIL